MSIFYPATSFVRNNWSVFGLLRHQSGFYGDYRDSLHIEIKLKRVGSIAGLARYAFYRSKIVGITIGDGSDSVAVALAVAFLFGYAGERLIAKVADSVGVSSQSNRDDFERGKSKGARGFPPSEQHRK